MKDQIKATIEAHAGELADISRWMYENPEVAYEERESSARLADFLKGNGFDVEYPAYGLETAFAARAGDTGPEVIICAEYDALPGVGHACGHNIIATSALGAGIGLLEAAKQLGFRITVLGTPAEEKYGGKVDLIKAGAFEGAACAMMVHPSTHDVVDPPVISVAHIDVIFRGKTAHASAYPFLGINALDAFVQAYVNVSTLRQQLEATDKVHGIVTHGGDAPNIIPDYTRSSWYVRAPQQDRLEVLLPRVLACFEAAATATGCTHEIEYVGHTYEDMISSPVLVELFAANSESLGRPMMRGKDLPPTVSGSTDMGNVSKLVPTIHPMISIDCTPAVNHQPEFAAHTITPAGEKGLIDGAVGMAWTVFDVADGDRWEEIKV
ncbi:MAG TPA: M20 family metallopeptidase [Acidimicrobiia bacterium]|nr:M20 family metallopeptidase [Acidimicrobiia bacterium]